MDPVTISLVIAALKEGIGGIIHLVGIMRANGDMTDAQAKALLDRIKAEAAESDAARDDAAEQTRPRLNEGGEECAPSSTSYGSCSSASARSARSCRTSRCGGCGCSACDTPG